MQVKVQGEFTEQKDTLLGLTPSAMESVYISHPHEAALVSPYRQQFGTNGSVLCRLCRLQIPRL